MTETTPKTWVTAEDVARKAGVSRSAVSRTFTDGASVSEKTRIKVEAAAQALGYQVNMLARSVIQKQSNLVGVVVKGFDDPFLQRLLGPITHELASRSLAPLLMDASEPKDMARSLQYLLQYRIAGVILTSGTPPIALAQEYLRLQIPVAMINRAPDLQGVDVVNSAHWEGGALAARTLLERGVKDVAYLSFQSATYSAGVRLEGFRATLAEAVKAGRIRLRVVEAATPSYQGGYDAAAQLFGHAGPAPDGVFCASDVLACGLIDGARHQRGYTAPGDFQIIGFDDIPMAGLAPYALTTIRQDVALLASNAVDCLTSRMADLQSPVKALHLPVHWVERSTLRSPGEDNE